MSCEICGAVIPPERLEILPDTRTCVKCSQVIAKSGVTVWDKTTPELVILSDPEEVKRFKKLEQGEGRSSRF